MKPIKLYFTKNKMKIFTEVGETRNQWGKLILYGSIAVGSSMVSNSYPILGDYTGIIVGGAFITPLTKYIARVSRYFQDVRLRVPKYIITGDGGDNYFSVITKKYWISFWKTPIDHIKLPILAQETMIPVSGAYAGSVCSGKRPLTNIDVKNCYDLPHGAKVKKKTTARYDWLIHNRDILTEDERYELEALELLEAHRVSFPT